MKATLQKTILCLSLFLVPLQITHSSVDTSMERLVEELKRDEGFMARAYRDHLGHWTIGYGRYLASYTSKTVSEAQAHKMLLEDLYKNLVVINDKMSWVNNLDSARKAVLLQMSYQMSAYKVLQFKTVLDRIQQGDYKEASAAMLQSRWAKQTPKRAQKLAKQMETGLWA